MRTPEAQVQIDYIAANVRRLRTRLGLSQAAFAEKAGCNPRWLQDLEVGKVDLRIQTLVRLASALGVSAASLLQRARLKVPKPGRPRASAGRKASKKA